MDKEILMYVASSLFGLLWFLLRQKDATQAAQIALLFTKHDQDAAELQALKLQIASQHYVKGELDNKFDKLEGAFRDGFATLGSKFDNLGQVLINHIQSEESKK